MFACTKAKKSMARLKNSTDASARFSNYMMGLPHYIRNRFSPPPPHPLSCSIICGVFLGYIAYFNADLVHEVLECSEGANSNHCTLHFKAGQLINGIKGNQTWQLQNTQYFQFSNISNLKYKSDNGVCLKKDKDKSKCI